MDRKIKANMILRDIEKGQCKVTDVAIPVDNNPEDKAIENNTKRPELKVKISKTWVYRAAKVKVTPAVLEQ